MKKITCLMLLFLAITTACYAERKELKYPNAVNPLFIDTTQIPSYEKFAQSIGFEIGVQYRYGDYVEINRTYHTGIAGNYEYLLLSTGGDENNFEAWTKFIQQPCGWEMTYYRNHDLTIIHETCHDDTRSFSYVRILKICKGKNPNLHLQ
ncbi:MAG: hypothetical protein FP816_09085 [Desulfobacteraceae bacterium]|nr:hypothetical protein [Desulfobacteraceae bacterium]